MHLTSTIATFLTITLLPPTLADPQSILLSKVQTLTLRADRQTTSRRVSSIPQLKCTAGDACKHYEPSLLRCTNDGSAYGPEDIEWTCTASLPPEFKLGATDVICEGYASPEDTHVLRGSCGVEYSLWLTEQGEQKFGSAGWFGGKKGSSSGRRYDDYDEEEFGSPGAKKEGKGSALGQALFFVVFFAVLVFILRGMYLQWTGQAPGARRAPRRPRGVRYGGWGGGGHDDGDDPPPPYDARDSYSYKQSSSRTQAGAQAGAWRPGFWSGLAGGTAAGYAAGRAGGSGRSAGSSRDSSGWGGGAGSSGGSAGPSYSSTRTESSGFGGTRRR